VHAVDEERRPRPRPAKAPDPAALLTRVSRALAFRVVTANVIGAATAFLNLSGSPSGSDLLFNWGDWISLAVLAGYLGFTMPVAGLYARRHFEDAIGWLRHGRAASPAERAATFALPRRLATSSIPYWLGAAALFGGLNHLVFGNSAAISGRVVVGIVLAGVTTSAITFLLVERALRPVFARALAVAANAPRAPAAESAESREVRGVGRAESAPGITLRAAVPGTLAAAPAAARPATLGIRPRLLLSWALGSGIPLLGVAVAMLSAHGGEGFSLLVWFNVAVGFLAGSVLMIAAARSVADPIEDVRAALTRVEQGELDLEVEITDGGEVGLLQDGFNRMVSGLRERRRLRDLLGRHVGTEVARHALERGVGLGGERRQSSVLFVDLIGSTALAQTRPPETVVAILNAFFGAVVRVMAAEGGWVNKFEGDGALCVFGAPNHLADHAARALRAARTLRAELATLASEHPGLDAAIGVASGPVVAGNVGAEDRYEYTVIGDPVNHAARLTDAAKTRATRVLASDDAVLAAGPAAGRWNLIGALDLRGRAQPTPAYEPA
jgi:adenylate cyclase